MTLAVVAEPVKLDLPVLIGIFGAAVVVVLAFAAATGWIGKIGVEPSGEAEELEPVVAGIGVGDAGVPRWLYAAYVIIPLWAMFFLVSNTKVSKEKVPLHAASAAPSPAASAAPAGGAGASPAATGPVQITAKDVAFDKKAFALPADVPTTIRFRNNDTAVQHNIAIYRDSAFSQVVFKGELFAGPGTREYKVPAMTAGTYYFHCDVHPPMQGTVTVA
jgi:plastocyanin